MTKRLIKWFAALPAIMKALLTLGVGTALAWSLFHSSFSFGGTVSALNVQDDLEWVMVGSSSVLFEQGRGSVVSDTVHMSLGPQVVVQEIEPDTVLVLRGRLKNNSLTLDIIPTYVPGSTPDYLEIEILNSWDSTPISPETGVVCEFRITFNSNLALGQTIDALAFPIDVSYAP